MEVNESTEIEELRLLTNEELLAAQETLAKVVFDQKMANSIGANESPARIKYLKRQIARIKTILRERELKLRGAC